MEGDAAPISKVQVVKWNIRHKKVLIVFVQSFLVLEDSFWSSAESIEEYGDKLKFVELSFTL